MKSPQENIFMRIQTYLVPAITLAVLLGIVALYVWDRRTVPERVADVVAQGDDVQVCEKFSQATTTDNLSYATICKNNIAKRLAVQKKDISYCNQLDDVLMSKDSCVSEVMASRIDALGAEAACAIDSNTPLVIALCKEATEKTLIAQAVEREDCSSITDSRIKSLCGDTLLIQKLISDAKQVKCTAFSSNEYASACTSFKKVIESKNISTESCDIIRNLELQRACFKVIYKSQ